MEMSLEYLRETVDFLRSRGFAVEADEEPFERDGERIYTTYRHVLSREPAERLAFSCVSYPDGAETYWLEIRRFHGLSTLDTELDSWKYRDDRIEFKYYARDDGVGLSFILELPPTPDP